MSGDYVICKADASPILEWPGGIAILTIRAGRRYSTAEAVVKQHPHLFRPLETAAPTQADGVTSARVPSAEAPSRGAVSLRESTAPSRRERRTAIQDEGRVGDA